MEFDGEFAITFGILSEYFEAQPSAGLTEVYYQAFKHWEYEDFKKGCERVMDKRVYKGLPKIPEIKEAIYGNLEDRAALAYHTMINALKRVGSWQTVIFEDGAIGQAIDAMGGWEYVNNITIDEWKFRRKDFESLYIAHTNRGDTKPFTCFGLFDKINGTSGHISQNKPILITRSGEHSEVERSPEEQKLLPGGGVKAA